MLLLRLLVPTLFLVVFAFAACKKVKIYNAFTQGAKEGLDLVVSLFPYLATIFILSELFEQSGLSALLCNALSPVFGRLGIPPELTKLLLIKPFSGSGSMALLTEILAHNPPDGYVARCAAVCYGSSETVFYISAVYFAELKRPRLAVPILIALISALFGAVVACLLCRVL